MENFKWLHLLYAVILISTAQVIVWFQHNWQFINPKMKPEWWGWYVVACFLQVQSITFNFSLKSST